jgi:hypothetical protein
LDLSIKMMGSRCTSGDDVLPLACVLLADAALQIKRMLGGLAPWRCRLNVVLLSK